MKIKFLKKKGLMSIINIKLKMKIIQLKKEQGFRLVKKSLKINEDFPNDKQVEVIIMSRNNSATSLRITKSIEKYKLDIQRSAWSGGSDISKIFKTI